MVGDLTNGELIEAETGFGHAQRAGGWLQRGNGL